MGPVPAKRQAKGASWSENVSSHGLPIDRSADDLRAPGSYENRSTKTAMPKHAAVTPRLSRERATSPAVISAAVIMSVVLPERSCELLWSRCELIAS